MHVPTAADLVVFAGIPETRALLKTQLALSEIDFCELIESSRRSIRDRAALSALAPLGKEAKQTIRFGCLAPATEALPDDFQTPIEAPFLSSLRCKKVNHIGRLQPIMDQGRRGTCVGCGTVAVTEFLQGRALSGQYLYWAAKMRDGHEKEEGTWIRFAAQALEEAGICHEKTWPYDPVWHDSTHQGPPPARAKREAAQNKARRSIRVNARSVNDLRQILYGTSSMRGRPISFSVPVFRSWAFNPITFRTGVIRMPLPGEEKIGGHCMTLVGYRDDGEWPGGGYFILRNSWGTRWASESSYGPGYGVIPYAYLEQYGWEAYTFEMPSESATVRRPDSGILSEAIYAALTGILLMVAFQFGYLPKPETIIPPAWMNLIREAGETALSDLDDAGEKIGIPDVDWKALEEDVRKEIHNVLQSEVVHDLKSVGEKVME